MSGVFNERRFRFVALKDGKEVASVKTFDTADKERSARRYFKRLGIEFDKVEFKREE